MAERLYILAWFWVAAGKSFRYFMLIDYKENYETEYTRIIVTRTNFS